MSHCDQETLSLLALGERASPPVAEHLAGCAQCRQELAALHSVVRIARNELNGALAHQGDGVDATEGTPVTRIPPPPQVWERIAAATGVSTQARPDVVIANSTAVADLAPPVTVLRDQASPPGPPSLSPSPSERLPRQRGRSGSLIAIAAALAVGLLGGFGIAEYAQQAPAPSATSPVLANTSLAGLALAPSARGDATVVRTKAGARLEVDVSRLGRPAGFYEVWLINSDITRMVAVGVLQGSKGEFTLPPGVDIAKFPLVDISIQSYNGNGGHSGRSVLRGTLKA